MKFITFFLTAIVLIQGCGYTTKSALPPEWRRVYIAPVVNDIDFTSRYERPLYTPLLEVKIRNAVSERFLIDGHLDVVNKPEDADIILSMRLKDFRHEPLRYEDKRVSEWRVAIVVSLELSDRRREESIWKANNFVGSQDRFRLGSQTSSEDAAVDAAVTDLSRNIVDSTIEHW